MSIPLLPPDTIPVLETERLLLRGCTPEDVAALFALFTDERVITAFGYRMEPSPDAANNIIQRWSQEFKNGTGIRWMIVDKESGATVGNIGLKDIKAYHQCGAIGYAVLPGYWRQGIAAEAMEMVLEHVFGTMDLHRVEAVVFPDNIASQALLHKLGFQREGLMSSSYRFDDAFHDSFLYAIINSKH